MILREPKMSVSECEFISECCSDWPGEAVFPQDVKIWIKRWKGRADEEGFIGHEDQDVGFIMLHHTSIVTVIHNLAVHPDFRGQKYASKMWRALRDELVSRGTTQVMFKALPGVIADLTGPRFEKIGEELGKTGPLVVGRVTADMDI